MVRASVKMCGRHLLILILATEWCHCENYTSDLDLVFESIFLTSETVRTNAEMCGIHYRF